VKTTRKLSRLQTLIAGGAFALAGIAGAPTAAMAAQTGHQNVITEPNATAAVSQVTDQATQSGPAPSASVESGSAPSDQDLHPVAVSGAQQQFSPDHEQLANTKAIVDAAKDMNLPPRAWEIAVATSIQESNLHNIGNLGAHNDHDSLGLFQQRTSTGGWGSAEQIQDPHHATTAFLQRLVKVPGWDSMPLTQAAQKVQVSAYPQAYAKHEAQAGNMIDALYGSGPYAGLAADLR
jgi:hypothetical protein